MKTCSVCAHHDLALIDVALIRGTPLRDLSAQFGTSPSALVRHKRHLSQKVIQAHQRAERARVRDLRREVRVLVERALGFLDRAEDSQDVRAAGVAFRETREALKLALQLDGELGPGGVSVAVGIGLTVETKEKTLDWFAGLIREEATPEERAAIVGFLRRTRRQRIQAEVAEVRRELDEAAPALPPPAFDAVEPSSDGTDAALPPAAAQAPDGSWQLYLPPPNGADPR